MLFNHQRHVSGMGDRAQGIGHTADGVLILRGQGQTDAGNLLGVKHPRQLVWKVLNVTFGRRNKVKLRLFGIDHVDAPY